MSEEVVLSNSLYSFVCEKDLLDESSIQVIIVSSLSMVEILQATYRYTQVQSTSDFTRLIFINIHKK